MLVRLLVGAGFLFGCFFLMDAIKVKPSGEGEVPLVTPAVESLPVSPNIESVQSTELVLWDCTDGAGGLHTATEDVFNLYSSTYNTSDDLYKGYKAWYRDMRCTGRDEPVELAASAETVFWLVIGAIVLFNIIGAVTKKF